MAVDWFSMNLSCSLPPRSVSTLPTGHSTSQTMLSPYLAPPLSCSPALPRSVKYTSLEVRLAVLIHPTSSFPWWITTMLQYYACTLSSWTLWVKVVCTTLHCGDLLAGKLCSQHGSNLLSAQIGTVLTLLLRVNKILQHCGIGSDCTGILA